MTGVSENLHKECHSAMLHDNMKIYRLLVHEIRVEKARSKPNSRDAKRPRSFDGGYSFKNWVSNQVPYKFPKASGDRVSKLK